MEALSSTKILCKRQRLAGSPVQMKSDASSRRSMLRRQASRLRLDAWLLTLCGVQRHHSQTLRPDHSVCWRQANDESFLIGKYQDSIPVILRATNGCYSPEASESLLHSTGLFWNISDFFLPFLLPWTQWRLKCYYSVLILSFSWIGRFWSLFW